MTGSFATLSVNSPYIFRFNYVLVVANRIQPQAHVAVYYFNILIVFSMILHKPLLSSQNDTTKTNQATKQQTNFRLAAKETWRKREYKYQHRNKCQECYECHFEGCARRATSCSDSAFTGHFSQTARSHSCHSQRHRFTCRTFYSCTFVALLYVVSSTRGSRRRRLHTTTSTNFSAISSTVTLFLILLIRSKNI